MAVVPVCVADRYQVCGEQLQGRMGWESPKRAGLPKGESPAQLPADGFIASLQMVLLALGTYSHRTRGW